MVITDCLVYRYIDHAGSIVKQRSASLMRRGIECYMDIFNTAAGAMSSHPHIADELRQFAQRQMVPFISRVLSSDLTTAEFRQLAKNLRDLGLLPVTEPGRIYRGVDFVISHPRYSVWRKYYTKRFSCVSSSRVCRETDGTLLYNFYADTNSFKLFTEC